MTLREAIMASDLNKVYAEINEKDSRNVALCDRPSMEKTVSAYTNVIKELLSKPRIKAYSMPWLIKETLDPIDKIKYADVCFLNPKYVEPTKGLKPWGCTKKNPKPPKGHYDCNANKHSKHFAAGWTPWSKIIDNPIINEGNYSLERVVAEILWEITFYGWTEDIAKKSVSNLKKRLESALKEIKDGKCIELPAKKKGGYKIVIPDSVSGQIIDIVNKESKKNK
jgi:hypothetical protein